MKLRIVFIIFILLISQQSYAEENDVEHRDSRDMRNLDEHKYSIKTDSLEEIDVKVIISNQTNDDACEKSKGWMSPQKISRDKGRERYFSFSRKRTPNIALYEWHMCFEIKGINYKAWRGFDPGPGAKLQVNCFIPSEQVEQKNTEKYLCENEEVTLNLANYNEYANICESVKKNCRRFEDKEELELWNQFNSNERVHDDITFAILTYKSEKDPDRTINAPRNIFLTVPQGEPSDALVKRLAGVNVNVVNGTKWIENESVRNSISSLTLLSPNLVEVYFFYYCGSLCAGGYTMTLELIDEKWTVKKSVMNWIS